MDVASYTTTAGRFADTFDTALDSEEHTLVLAFASSSFADDPAPLLELRRAYPRAQLIGCSTSGEIFGTKVSDGSVAAVVARFRDAKVRAARAKLGTSSSSSRAAGEELGRRLSDLGDNGSERLRAIIVLSDGLAVNGSELVTGLGSVVRKDVVVTGGLAGDGAAFKRTFVLDDDGVPCAGVVTAVGIYGDSARIGHGSKGGWDAFGPERLVTRSAGNVLFELDGKPALQLYKTYLGERAAGLPGTALLFPLALRRGEGAGARRIVRTVLGVDEAAQSMTFAGDIEQGAFVQLMRANFDRLVQGASDAALMANAPSDGPVINVAISCVGRRLVLGERVEEETEAALDMLPPGSTQIGYYSYGEISPFVAGEPCDLHNQTMTITTLAEAPR